MKPSDLATLDAARVKLLLAWQRKAAGLITAKMDDAEAHANKALTDTLKTKPDGRPTLRHASRSPSYKAALARLDELLEKLAGPSRASLDGLVRDAREAFWRASFDRWKPVIPAELWRSTDPQTTNAEATEARRIVLHGLDVRDELQGPIGAAQRKLLAVLTQAGSRSTPERIADDLLSTWRKQAESAIVGVTGRALSDSEVRLDVLAGRAVVADRYLEAEPAAVGA